MKAVRTSIFTGASFAFSSVLTCAAALVGCGGADAVTGTVNLIDRSSSALTVDSVMAIEGSYGAGCTDRSGTWAIALNGYTLVASETQLTVITDDVGCALSVTRVKAGAVATPLVYTPPAPLPLTTSYATLGTAFLLNGAGATQFYANFLVSPDLAFTSDFVVQMIYSDDLSKTNLGTGTNFAVTVATATAGVVPAPNSTLALGALDILVNADDVVHSASGSATLTQGAVIGGSYVVDFDTLGTSQTCATVDATFNAPGKTPVALVGPSQEIQASDFNFITLNLTTPQYRNVIVANIVNGVNSYQMFQIAINVPMP